MTEPEAPLAEAIRRDLTVAVARETPTWSVAGLEVVSGGRSALTALAELVGPGGASRRVAVRAVGRDSTQIAISSLRDHFELLELLRSEPVLAPRPVLLAEGLAASSYDLLVTEYVAGRIPQPWRRAGRAEIATLRSNERFRDDFVETLVRIHAVAAKRLPSGLAHEGEGSARTHSDRARERSTAAFAASGVFADDPVLTYCNLWLEQHRPATTFAAGLVHGDYRLGNLVVDDDGRLRGVLDWELAEAGETLSDVAWLCGRQGMIDGHAAGLFAPDELVTAYETATGRTTDTALFDHLRLEGTMRTAGVWAQLSVVELERGNPALSVRCQESVVELVGMCADGVGLPVPPVDGLASPADLTAGAAVLSRRLHDALVAEGRTLDSPHPAAVRHAGSFLRRLSEVLATSDFEQYADECASFARSYATGHPGFTHDVEAPPGATLSAVARHRHASGGVLDAAAPEATELRRLVAASSSSQIAFANLLAATGARAADR